MESTNSCKASGANSLRGCNGLGVILARSTWLILSPDSESGRGAGRLPISAPKPLPRPDFAGDVAMRLRLPEHLAQGNRQQPWGAAHQYLTTMRIERCVLQQFLTRDSKQ